MKGQLQDHKHIVGIHDAPPMHWVGDGFPVRPMMTIADYKALDPFLMLDYAAPMTFEPAASRRGVGQHPHRGFETVTVVYQGELEHRDSTGAGGTIGPGDVQWMTAASGILHKEYHQENWAREGGTFQMMQLWVNLPASHKSAAPGYQTLLKDEIPYVALDNGAGHVRVIAGGYQGTKGPARTFTPINVWDVSIAAGKSATLPMPDGHSAALALLRGAVSVNGADVARSGQLVVLERAGSAVTLGAESDSLLLVLSGEPIGEAIAAYGPFVMNTKDEIQQAMRDFNNGTFGTLS
ncbi:MAG: pirin family protein [Hyphomicrobium sp.]